MSNKAWRIVALLFIVVPIIICIIISFIITYFPTSDVYISIGFLTYCNKNTRGGNSYCNSRFDI